MIELNDRKLRLSWAHAVVALLLLGLTPMARGQGFVVKPMKIEVQVRPGEQVEVPLEIRNTVGDDARVLDVRLVELSQSAEGNWTIIERDEGVDTSGLASAFDWIILSRQEVEVPALGVGAVQLTVDVPRQARGIHFAGLIVQTRRPQGATGMAVIVRFLIPVVVTVQGPPEQQQIRLQELGMKFLRQPDVAGGTTAVSMQIANEGRTYSRLQGNVRVHRFNDTRWHPVSSVDLREVGIIPGVTLNLTQDIQKRLPSGRYKLTGTLYVDGRRIAPVEQEIEFEGDPSVTTLAVDTALMLDPTEIALDASPGATRTAVLSVENASEEAVEIEAAAQVPPSLTGVMLGEMRGDAMSAAQWLQVSPAKFTLRGGRKQNVRVVARLPRDGIVHPNYYGLLTLKATYPDGQSAGETSTFVTLSNSQAASVPNGQIVKASLAGDEPGKYIVQARISNTGNVHVTPGVGAVLLTGRGERVAEVQLEGDTSLMLPLATRDFSGVMDFAAVEAGTYLLRVDYAYAAGQAATEQMPLRVTVEDGQRIVSLIQSPEAEPPPLQAAAAATQPAGGQ